jgi:hypothetical protein
MGQRDADVGAGVVIRERPDLRRARLRQQWHRKFAFWPLAIGTQQIWLQWYWRRFVPWGKPKSVEEKKHYEWRVKTMMQTMIYIPWGHWEYSVLDIGETRKDNVVVVCKVGRQ